MSIKKFFWLLDDSGINLSSYFGDALVYFLDPANTSTMKKENATSSTPITAVTTDADPIGLIYDRGYHGFYATAESDATRPTLSSDATQRSFISFSSAASSRFNIINSQSYLRKFSEASSTWCIATRIKMGASTDGVTNYILMSHSDSTANFGLRLIRSNANKWQLWIVYGSGGNQRCIFSSAQTQVEADGWVDVIVYANGASGTIIIGNTSENFTLTSGATGNATNDMRVGSSATGTSPFKGGMGYLVILNRIPTAAEITTLKAYNPARNTRSWSTNTTKFDFNNSLKGWADTGKTTPITNGVAIRAWEPETASIFGPLNRDLTTASAGVSPVWTTNLENSKAGLVFDGTDDQVAMTSSFFRERGGIGVLLSVAKNVRPELGSHLLSSGLGTNYVVITGSTYPSGVLGVGNTYFTTHPSAGGGIGPCALQNKVEATNVIVIRRNGSAWSEWTGEKVEVTATDSNSFFPTTIGALSIAGWQFSGNLMKMDYYSGIKSNAEIEALIDIEKSAYAI